MTHYSLRITERPPELCDADLKLYSAKLPTVRDLDRHARGFGAYGMRRWAQERALTIHYVDNCWVRVDASAEIVRTFLQQLGEPPADLDANGRYLIEAEEF